MSRKIIPIPKNKFPAYTFTKYHGWHTVPLKLNESKGTFAYFGTNWWDLLYSDKLFLHKGQVSINTKETSSIILINLGKDSIKIMNQNTADVYNVLPGKRSSVNNTEEKNIILVAENSTCEINITKIYSSHLVLLNVQEIREGISFIQNSCVFTDFLLMSGVPDRIQYMDSMGLETLDYVITNGWKYIETESGSKDEFTSFLLDQWKICNPAKRVKSKKTIPHVIQWIWLRRDPRKKEYGKLRPSFYKYMKTWIDKNPNFTFNLWTDNKDIYIPKQFQGIITIKGPDEIENALNRLDSAVKSKIKYLYYNHINVGARSDCLRQVLLYEFGGLYGDISDASCLVPIQEFLDRFDYICGIEPTILLNNAILGSKKKHIISKAMIVWLAENSKTFVEEWKNDYINKADKESMDDYIVSTTGPISLSQVLFGVMKKHFSKLKHSLILPSSWVYGNYWIKESPIFWLKPVSLFAHFDARDFLK